MPVEATLIERVRGEFERDSRIPHPAEIAVSARAGSVTLQGTVATPRQVQAAVEIARATPGVDVVTDLLHVDLRDHWEDDELRGVALQTLILSDEVPPDRVDVAVSNGWLTLEGRVRRQPESNAAFEAVADLPGVGGITNDIQVVTAGMDG